MFGPLGKRFSRLIITGDWLNRNAQVAIGTIAAGVLSFLLLIADGKVSFNFGPRGSAVPSGKLVPLIVAARPLLLGTVLLEPDLKTINIPAEAFPRGGFIRAEDLIGRSVFVNSLAPGEPIFDSFLRPRGVGGGLPSLIPDGMRAVTVKVDDVGALVGFAYIGSRVDVFATAAVGGRTTTVLCAQDALNLAAGNSFQRPYDIPTKPEKPPPNFTLLVPTDQAQALVNAASNAKLTFALRSGIDHAIIGPQSGEPHRESEQTRPGSH